MVLTQVLVEREVLVQPLQLNGCRICAFFFQTLKKKNRLAVFPPEYRLALGIYSWSNEPWLRGGTGGTKHVQGQQKLNMQKQLSEKQTHPSRGVSNPPCGSGVHGGTGNIHPQRIQPSQEWISKAGGQDRHGRTVTSTALWGQGEISQQRDT